jgi:DNA-binding transcriptional ArsR family regulator
MDKFNALAEPNRRRILEMIAIQGPLAVSEINEHFGISAPAISQHLKVLREAGLLQMQKKAQRRLYSLQPDGVDELWQWLSDMRQFWHARLDSLEVQLNKDLKGEST